MPLIIEFFYQNKKQMCRMLRIIILFRRTILGALEKFSMELRGSHLGSLGFSRTDIYESVLMCFKDAICLRNLLLKMALDTMLKLRSTIDKYVM